MWKPASANPRLDPRSRVTCLRVVIPGTTISSCNSASSSSALTRWIVRTIFSTPPFETKRCLFDQELHVRLDKIPAYLGLFEIDVAFKIVLWFVGKYGILIGWNKPEQIILFNSVELKRFKHSSTKPVDSRLISLSFTLSGLTTFVIFQNFENFYENYRLPRKLE